MTNTGAVTKRRSANELTPAQSATLRAIRDFIKANNIAPTYDELSAILGVTKTAVRQSIEILRRKEVLKRTVSSYRSLVLTRHGHKVANHPPSVR